MKKPVDPSPAEPDLIETDLPPFGMGARLRNYFLTGLVVAGPLFITGWLIWAIVTWVDDLVRQRILQDGVNGKIPAGTRLLKRHVRIAFNDKSSVTPSDLPFSTRQSNVKAAADLVNRKCLSYNVQIFADARRKFVENLS